jgi:hypothetical protein
VRAIAGIQSGIVSPDPNTGAFSIGRLPPGSEYVLTATAGAKSGRFCISVRDHDFEIRVPIKQKGHLAFPYENVRAAAMLKPSGSINSYQAMGYDFLTNRRAVPRPTSPSPRSVIELGSGTVAGLAGMSILTTLLVVPPSEWKVASRLFPPTGDVKVTIFSAQVPILGKAPFG